MLQPTISPAQRIFVILPNLTLTSLVFPFKTCPLETKLKEKISFLISSSFQLITSCLARLARCLSLQTVTWQYPDHSSTFLSALLALSSAGSWPSTFSLVSTPDQNQVPSLTFLYFPVLVSAPVFFAWSDGRHHAETFNGSAQVGSETFRPHLTVNNLIYPYMSHCRSFYFCILGKECPSLI